MHSSIDTDTVHRVNNVQQQQPYKELATIHEFTTCISSEMTTIYRKE